MVSSCLQEVEETSQTTGNCHGGEMDAEQSVESLRRVAMQARRRCHFLPLVSPNVKTDDFNVPT